MAQTPAADVDDDDDIASSGHLLVGGVSNPMTGSVVSNLISPGTGTSEDIVGRISMGMKRSRDSDDVNRDDC